MKKRIWTGLVLLMLVPLSLGLAQNPPPGAQEALADYRAKGAKTTTAKEGKRLWAREFTAKDGSQRSCVTCHNADLKTVGAHARTKKKIEPMAFSVNAERYTKKTKIEKWFLRNCKWTWGRVCTPQEKADFLGYLLAE